MKKYLLIYSLFLLSSCSNFSYETDILPKQVPSFEVATDLPIVNIKAEPADFDQLMDNPEEDIDIAGTFNLYRNNALIIQNEQVELSIKGGFSLKLPLKSLGVKFEDKYDNSDRSLINPEVVLPHHNIDKIKAIRLRNSGSDFRNTMLKDLSMTQLAINATLDLDLTYGEPALVYVNEDFYGLMNIRTEANTHGMAGLNGVKKKDITLAKITTREFLKKDGDFERIDRFVQAIEQKDIEYIKTELDLPNFIDYMAFESYLGNTDWPHNNARFYAVKDGKFRFVLFDLDKVAWLKMEKSPIDIITKQFPRNILTDLFSVLYEDVDFKTDFDNRLSTLLETEVLSYDKLKIIVEKNAANIRSEIPLQTAKYQVPKSTMFWEVELDKMLILFREREAVVQAFLKK